MDAINQLFMDYPILRAIWDALCVIIPFSTLLAFAGLDFLSVAARILSITRNRSSYDKCGRQIALLCVILGWGLLIGSRIWLYLANPAPNRETIEYFVLETSWVLLSIGVLLCSIYYTLWKVLKTFPVLHTTIGMISAVQCCFSTLVILAATRFYNIINTPNSASASLQEIFPLEWNSPLWIAVACAVPLIFAMPAAWAAVWLPLRRKSDDFGRDYYNTMVAWCARWACNAWLVLWLVLLAGCALETWTEFEKGAFNEQNAIFESLRLILWLIPALLWHIAARSPLAMRHRGGLFLALALSSCFTLPYYYQLCRIL